MQIDRSGFPPGFEDALRFPLVEALFGRRARRFSMGASIPEGELAYTSDQEPFPLDDLEQMMVLAATAGNTGWHYAISHNARYAPHLPNYACAAGGRTFPSAAGFHTSQIFYTDDDGVYLLDTRDAPALAERQEDGTVDPEALIEAHRARVRKLADGRLHLPAAEPYMDGHNHWCVNRPGTTLVIPVGDLAQHLLAGICYWALNGHCIYDDVHDQRIPGMESFGHLVDVENPYPLNFAEQVSLAECTVELGAACYAGMLMLQAMGLGGWLFDGMDPYTVLGASGEPDVPGLGFRYDTDERWALPNVTGLPGVFEGFCPPHYPDMRAAVEALAERKFGAGGPFHPNTPGMWRESARVRASAAPFTDEFKECVTLQAQYVYDRFGKFPGTVPSIFCDPYLQAHHLDLGFYDHHFREGAYLRTHAEHLERWHPSGA